MKGSVRPQGGASVLASRSARTPLNLTEPESARTARQSLAPPCCAMAVWWGNEADDVTDQVQAIGGSPEILP